MDVPPAGAAAEEHPLHLALPGAELHRRGGELLLYQGGEGLGLQGLLQVAGKEHAVRTEHVLPADVAQPQLAAQGHVDPAHRGQIQIGVAAQGGNAPAGQLVGHVLGAQGFEGVENHRVVGEDEVGVHRGRLRHHGGGDVQGQQGPGDDSVAVAHQQTGVVEVQGGGKGRHRVDDVVDVTNPCHKYVLLFRLRSVGPHLVPLLKGEAQAWGR